MHRCALGLSVLRCLIYGGRSGGAVSLNAGSDNHRRELRHRSRDALIDLAHWLDCGVIRSSDDQNTNKHQGRVASDDIFEMPNWYLKTPY